MYTAHMVLVLTVNLDCCILKAKWAITLVEIKREGRI